MSTPKLVAIAGISSKLALLITKELLAQDPNVQIRGSSRNPDKLPSWVRESSRVETVEIKDVFDSRSLESLVAGSDIVICAYFADNHTMEDGQKLLVDACERNNVPRYVASDWTVDYTKLDFGDNELKDPMKRVKAYIDAKPSVQGVHILTGVFLELYWQYWAPWDPVDNTLAYWGSGEEKWELTSMSTIAQYSAAVILDPSAHGVLKFSGNRPTIRNIAEDFYRAHGIRVSLKCLGTLEDLQKTIKPPGEAQNLMASGEYWLLNGKSSLGLDLSNDSYPQVTPETFADFFKSRSLAALRPQYSAAEIKDVSKRS